MQGKEMSMYIYTHVHVCFVYTCPVGSHIRYLNRKPFLCIILGNAFLDVYKEHL